jgi:HSP20 family protein
MFPSLTTSFPGDLFAELDAMHREMSRLFGHTDWPSSIRAAARGAFPAVNMGTTEEAVEVYAFAPGLDPSRIEVSVDKGVLTLAGERAPGLPADDGKVDVYARERFAGSFKRVIGLPQDVDATRVQASYRNGVLKVLVPKQERAKPRRVEVKELESQQ